MLCHLLLPSFKIVSEGHGGGITLPQTPFLLIQASDVIAHYSIVWPYKQRWVTLFLKNKDYCH